MKHSTLLLVGFFLAIGSGGAGAGAGAGERVSVLVLPFDAASPDVQWAGRAVGQNLVAELSAIPMVSAIAGAKVAASPEDAASIARPMGAQFVVFGGVQAVEREVRVTGFVVDVAGSQTVGVLKATGAARDAFALQDQIADQAKAALPVPAAAALEDTPVTRPAAGATAGTTVAQAATAPATAPYLNRIERGIARIEQSSDRVRELEAEVDRLNARLRELERDNDRSPPPLMAGYYQGDSYYDYPYSYPYFGSLYYSPIFFAPICKPGHHHHGGHGHHHRGHIGNGGVNVRGSFNRGNFSGNFGAGGAARAMGGGGRAMGGGGRAMGGGVRAGGVGGRR